MATRGLESVFRSDRRIDCLEDFVNDLDDLEEMISFPPATPIRPVIFNVESLDKRIESPKPEHIGKTIRKKMPESNIIRRKFSHTNFTKVIKKKPPENEQRYIASIRLKELLLEKYSRDAVENKESLKSNVQRVFSTSVPFTRYAWKKYCEINSNNFKYARQYLKCDDERSALSGSRGGDAEEYEYVPPAKKTKFQTSDIPISPRKKIVQRNSLLTSMSVPLKPGPLSKKVALQNKNMPYIKLVTLPKVILEVYPEIGRGIDPNACYYLNDVRSKDGTIDGAWANFATSVLVDDHSYEKMQIPHRFSISYENDQTKILMDRDIDCVTSFRSSNADPIENIDPQGRLVNLESFEPQDKEESTVKCIVRDIVNSIYYSEQQDKHWKYDDDYNPMTNAEAPERVLNKDKRSKGKYYELKLLNISLPDSDDEPCLKFKCCELGCVCSSINKTSMFNRHCGKPECMFLCKCNSRISDNPELDISKYKRGLRQRRRHLSTKISLTKLPNKLNLEPWCMVHQLYRCFCSGKAVDGYEFKLCYVHENESIVESSEIDCSEKRTNNENNDREELRIEEVSTCARSTYFPLYIHRSKNRKEKLANRNERIKRFENVDNRNQKRLEFLIKTAEKYDQLFDNTKSTVHRNKRENSILKSTSNKKSETVIHILDSPKNAPTTTDQNTVDMHIQKVQQVISDGRRIEDELPEPTKDNIVLYSWEKLLENYVSKKHFIWARKKEPYKIILCNNNKNLMLHSDDYAYVKKTMDRHILKFHKPMLLDLINEYSCAADGVVLVGKQRFWEITGVINSDPNKQPKVKDKPLKKPIQDNLPTDQLAIEKSNLIQNTKSIKDEVEKVTGNLAAPVTTATQLFREAPNQQSTNCSMILPIPSFSHQIRMVKLTVFNDFCRLIVPHRHFSIYYKEIISALTLSNNTKKTVRIRAHKDCPDRIEPCKSFGLYAVPNVNNEVFLGPYEMNEDMGFQTVNKELDGDKAPTIRTQGVWLYHINQNPNSNAARIDNKTSHAPKASIPRSVLGSTISGNSNVITLARGGQNLLKNNLAVRQQTAQTPEENNTRGNSSQTINADHSYILNKTLATVNEPMANNLNKPADDQKETTDNTNPKITPANKSPESFLINRVKLRKMMLQKNMHPDEHSYSTTKSTNISDSNESRGAEKVSNVANSIQPKRSIKIRKSTHKKDDMNNENPASDLNDKSPNTENVPGKPVISGKFKRLTLDDLPLSKRSIRTRKSTSNKDEKPVSNLNDKSQNVANVPKRPVISGKFKRLTLDDLTSLSLRKRLPAPQITSTENAPTDEKTILPSKDNSDSNRQEMPNENNSEKTKDIIETLDPEESNNAHDILGPKNESKDLNLPDHTSKPEKSPNESNKSKEDNDDDDDVIFLPTEKVVVEISSDSEDSEKEKEEDEVEPVWFLCTNIPKLGYISATKNSNGNIDFQISNLEVVTCITEEDSVIAINSILKTYCKFESDDLQCHWRMTSDFNDLKKIRPFNNNKFNNDFIISKDGFKAVK